MDIQTKTSQRVYEKLDHYINAIDSNIQDINSSLSLSISKQDYSQTKKRKYNKKNSSNKDEQVAEFEIPIQAINEPIDPNEPVYCTCRQVSFGRMVGCENESCRYEWFHFECVGLKEEPNDVWYCSECSTSVHSKI
jgi:inhibitor of growth protein 4